MWEDVVVDMIHRRGHQKDTEKCLYAALRATLVEAEDKEDVRNKKYEVRT